MEDNLVYECKMPGLHGVFQIRAKKDPDYIYLHMPQSSAKGIAVLLYSISDKGINILGRFEKRPCHKEGFDPKKNNLFLTSITGTLISPEEELGKAVKKEIEEEAGVEINEKDIRYLGKIYSSKYSDERVYMFAVDISKATMNSPKNVGELEEGGFVKWLDFESAVMYTNCPLLATMCVRLEVLERKKLSGFYEYNDEVKKN